jgi:hypothetical protein
MDIERDFETYIEHEKPSGWDGWTAQNMLNAFKAGAEAMEKELACCGCCKWFDILTVNYRAEACVCTYGMPSTTESTSFEFGKDC